MVLTIDLFARSLSELPHLRQLRFFLTARVKKIWLTNLLREVYNSTIKTLTQ